MGDISFAIDGKAFYFGLIILVGGYFLYLWSQRFLTPKFKFSNLDPLLAAPSSWRQNFSRLPKTLEYTALACLWIAFINPHFFLPKSPENLQNLSPEPVEGIAIYLILDQSGSMAERIDAVLPNGNHRHIPKIDLLKLVTTDFIKERPNDMIGIIGFSRGAQVLAPLTLDHRSLLEVLKNFSIQKAKDQEGTSIGYAIYKTANLISATRHYAMDLIEEGEPAYNLKSAIMILVTDGVQESNPLDKGNRLRSMNIPDAAEYAKQQNIRLYIINVEPQIATPEFAPHRRQMQEAAKLTGGDFYLVTGGVSLDQIYDQIDHLEKTSFSQQEELLKQLQQAVSKENLPRLYRQIYLYPYFIGAALILLLAAALLNATLMKRVP